MATGPYVDKEFAALCPPLTPEERGNLESSIIAEGCREKIIVWIENAKELILDGHNRFEICTRFSKDYKTDAKKLADRNEARNWIIANQLGRRNLTEDQKSYLRGKRYAAEKESHGGQVPGSCQNGNSKRTSEKLAEEYGVGSRTIHRDAEFASAVDAIAASAGEQARRDILSGELRATKQDVVALAELPPSQQKAAVASGAEGVRRAVGGKSKSKRRQGPRFDEEAFSPLLDRLEEWIGTRFDKAGGAESRDNCTKLTGQLRRSIEQWQRQKPIE
jgi:hypothetical protein